MDLLGWTEDEFWNSLTESQLAQITRIANDLDIRYPDPGDRHLREAVLHGVICYLMGHSNLEQFGRALKGRENVAPKAADELRKWPNPREALATVEQVAVLANADGVPELVCARAFGVDWMTVRGWLGKGVPGHGRQHAAGAPSSTGAREYLDDTLPPALAQAFLAGERVRYAFTNSKDHGHRIAWSELRRFTDPDVGDRCGVIEEDSQALHYWDYSTLEEATARFDARVHARAESGADYDQVDGVKSMDVQLQDLLDDDLRYP